MGRRLRLGAGLRLVIALLLTLGPAAGLAAIGYRAVAERQRGLRVTFTATAVLVRDRIAAELAADVSTMTGTVPSIPAAADLAAWQAVLRKIEREHAWVADPYVIRADGGVVTADAWLNWPTAGGAWTPPPAAVAAALGDAEVAEFQKNDLELALGRYRRAVASAERPADRLLPLARVGRTLFKLKRFEEGLTAYRSILALQGQAPGAVDAHGVPFRAMALAEICDGLDALGRAADRDRAGLDLRREVADHPWDVASGYAYWVKLAQKRHATPDATVQPRLSARARAVTLVEQIARQAPSAREAPKPGLLPIAAANPEDPPMAMGYAIRPDYVAGPLLEKVVKGVELGSSVRVAIRNGARADTPELAAAEFGAQVPGWRVAIVDTRGRTIDQLTARERWAYGGLVGGVLAVLVAGLVFMTRAWAREAELSRLRTDFVSNVSHELKTPLALIRMFGETLESGLVDDPAKRQEFYGIIRRESERLTHLINNVLDAAKIEAGTKQFTLESGDLVSLVREALEAYAPLFRRLQFSVEADLPDAALAVAIDRDAVAQALVNLFQNAIRYSGDARHVGVAVSVRDSEAIVTVTDRGIGIPKDDLPRIFDKFYRSRAADVTGAAGSGLGLSIVQHVMAAHGGRVEVDSTVGHGSTFTLVFPQAGSAA